MRAFTIKILLANFHGTNFLFDFFFLAFLFGKNNLELRVVIDCLKRFGITLKYLFHDTFQVCV